MNTMTTPRLLLAAAVMTALAGCATTPVPDIARNPDPATLPTIARNADGEAIGGPSSAGEPDMTPGSGIVINESLAAQAPPQLPEGGEATFNFEGESLHAVVKAVLGDLLQQNYVIAPTVQGTVTLATPRPVSPAQALSLLEMVLGWNNARLVWSNGRYAILPADQAVAGNLSPRTGTAANARGFELRAVPLQYVSATEMEKLLKPYVRQGAVVQADAARNLIVLSGSRNELENYLRTVRIFDVDWLKGMSVGVFPIQSAEPEKIVTALERVFGAESGTPLAGMFRFLPVEGSNSIIVITPQRQYLQNAREWIEKLDMAGEGARLFVYEVKYMKAGDLASQLGTVFDASVSSSGGSGSASISPGLTPVELGAVSREAGQISQPQPAGGGGASLGSGSGESGIGISAIEESNALMVRASPAQWESIRRAIERLDVMPAQVHIEAQVLEVTLQGNLSYGVNWYFENAIPTSLAGALRPGRSSLGFVGGSLAQGTDGIASAGATFTSRNAVAVVNLLERESDVRVLSTPSLFVRNNAEAALNVGQNLAVASTSFNPGTGTTPGNNTISSVQYLSTGTKLKVKPRIGGDGMVFLEIEQEISSPSEDPGAGGNPNVNTSTVTTEALVRDGETVMLAGLIRQSDNGGSSGVPGLTKLPVVGGLFGTQGRSQLRSEVVLLITPRVVRTPQQTRTLTDDYLQRFQGLAPLRAPGAATATPAADPPPGG
ncbi:type II secretion system secretin GspD [Silanimonas sp.]|uniref:type II secretion system secretin GspD n=1 Tax=Silanimonas sp. TaxID=1929290 RepID=UPI0022CA6AD3|nr:type II secretion system secretin GspD [Silanimonas sp.]MCZ8164351.1 type II secretion system secretin GspD [Silanimonas sp.]